MRVTKAELERANAALRAENFNLRRELEAIKEIAAYNHRLVERLLTIFERTAGEAQLRLTAAGALTATDLELAKRR